MLFKPADGRHLLGPYYLTGCQVLALPRGTVPNLGNDEWDMGRLHPFLESNRQYRDS